MGLVNRFLEKILVKAATNEKLVTKVAIRQKPAFEIVVGKSLTDEQAQNIVKISNAGTVEQVM